MKKYSYIYAIWAVIFILFPIFLIFFYSLGGVDGADFSNYARFFEPIYLKVFALSIALSAISTLLCLLIGYPIAYIISRMEERHRNNVIMLFVIPMWMNFLLRTYAWLSLLGNNGLINKFLNTIGLSPLNLIYNYKAVSLGMVYNFLPFMVLPIYTVLTKMDMNLLEAAKDLGANSLQSFIKITLPLSLKGVYTGITMVFIPALSTFVIPNLLGGNKFYLIGNLIEQQFTFTGNWAFGSAVSIVLILFMLFIVIIPRIFKKDKSYDGTGEFY